MSQSEAHKNLVIEVSKALIIRYPEISIAVDVRSVFGNLVPPLVGGFRPDVYANMPDNNLFVIAEAKTSNDLDTRHTYNQITAFTQHLETKPEGLFILSISGHDANRAKSLMRFIRQRNRIKETKMEVFDECDFWLLESSGGRIWHLN